VSRTVLLVSLQKDIDVIGLKSLHYYLLNNSCDSHLLFLPTYHQDDHVALKAIYDFISTLSPSLIGISLMSVEFYGACNLTEHIKSHFAPIPVVWGGIHPTIVPIMCLAHADYVCIGEGEKTLLDLVNAIDEKRPITSVNNLCYKPNDEIKCNQLYPLISDLSEIPPYEHMPRNSHILDHGTIKHLDIPLFRKHARYSGTTYSVISSRGCPFSCTYCCNNVLTNLYGSRKLRYRSTSDVITELERAIRDNPYIEYVNFQDDCFLARSDDHLHEFCCEYKKRINKPFIVRSIPIYVTRDKMVDMKVAGLAWISLGLQSGSDRICRDIYKRKSLKADFLKAASIVKDLDVAAFYDVILDNPFATDEDRLETVYTLMETPKPFYTQFFSLTLYEGTELYNRAQTELLVEKDQSLRKDYLLYNQTPLNDMKRLATFLSEERVKHLVYLYTDKRESMRFRLGMLFAKMLSGFIYEPYTDFRVILLSQRGDFIKALKVLPNYLKEGLMRYFNQFRRRRPRKRKPDNSFS